MKLFPPLNRHLPGAPLVLGMTLLGSQTFGADVTYLFNDFSDLSSLQLNGSAAGVNDGSADVLRLTGETQSQSGSAFVTSPITLASDASFSVAFAFRISSVPSTYGDSDGPGADGLVFVLQTVANNVGAAGGGIGYHGIAKSVGIEYDTYDNGSGNGDPDGNHVGINFGGVFGSGPVGSVTPRLNDGTVWYSWIDYDGASDSLEVRLSQTDTRPVSTLLSHIVGLTTILESSSAYFGFTSGTGGGFGNHDILQLQFRNSFNPIERIDEQPSIPEANSWIAAGFIGSLAVWSFARRQRNR